jgi:hypothetical protein
MALSSSPASGSGMYSIRRIQSRSGHVGSRFRPPAPPAALPPSLLTATVLLPSSLTAAPPPPELDAGAEAGSVVGDMFGGGAPLHPSRCGTVVCSTWPKIQSAWSKERPAMKRTCEEMQNSSKLQ